ncbi:hypothetical protein EBR21_08805, partial [bacterium]|nr:hypothetical protein [bacterium]
NLTANIPLTIISDTALGKIMLSTTDASDTASMPNYSADPQEVACAQLNPSDLGVTCPTLYAYHYDAWGNKLASAPSGHNCNWSSGETNAHSKLRASNDTNKSVNDLITCSNTTPAVTSNSVRLYGGPNSVVVTSNPPATTLTAGFGNFQISKVAVRSLKNTTAVAMPGLDGQSLSVGFSMSTGSTNTIGTSPELATTSTIHAGSVTCTFSASGECSPNAIFNFKKVDATARTLTTSVRGVSTPTTITSVSAGNAAKLTVSGLNSTYDVDTAYASATSALTATVSLADAFDNATSKNSTGGTCASTDNVSVTGNDEGAYADSLSGSGATATLKIYKAKTHTLTFTRCGVSANQTLTITAGAVRRTLLTNEDAQPSAYDCVTSTDTIDTTRTCSLAKTCAANAAGTAAGANCGALYAWHYDKAGNFITGGSKSCGTSTTAMFDNTATTVAAAATTATFAASGTGFSVTAPDTSKYLQGNVTCKPTTTANYLGGTQVAYTAPVTLAAPTVECSPWIYDANSAATSVCTFKNTTGVDLLSAAAYSPNQTPSNSEDYPILLHEPSMTATIAANSFAQFLVNGVAGKKTTIFKVKFSSGNQNVFVNDSPALRVPARTIDNAATPSDCNPGCQNTAADAGAALNNAEEVETGNLGATDRRALYRATFTWGTCTAPYQCAADDHIGALNTSGTLIPLLITDRNFKLNAHYMTREFFDVDMTQANNNRCYNKNSFTDNDNDACHYDVRIDTSKGKSIRGVFWLKDVTGTNYYFMTDQDPTN